eukprot:Phypoly_transcript_03160.p1 GENE.Phypoly_transcript_03160~~Phypoly_transcript_03160.p1  ORF type:complete len:475 (-),score=55.20 Phypoly_transcript_03160:75-1499(-)
MELEDLLAPPSNSILLRVVPSTATTAGGKLVIPHKGVLEFLKDVTLSSTCRKTEVGASLVDVVSERGDDIAELLECSPGSTGIIVASSYGLSLLLYENVEDNTTGDIVRLSHGCLLVLIETRDDPALFNVPDFVLRLQHISGDVNLTLKEPPKLLYHECEGNFVTAPLKDAYAREILLATEKIDIGFFANESHFAHILETIRKFALGWVIWPRILLYVILDKSNKTRWAGVLQKMIPSLPQEERSLALLILENMKAKFGNFTHKQESVPVGLSMAQIMLIQPLISTILYGQLLSPFVMLAMSDILLKRANLAAAKYSKFPCLSKCIPKLSQQSQQHHVDLTICSKPLGKPTWTRFSYQRDKSDTKLVVTPQTQVHFQISNRSAHPVCWQIWNLPSKPQEQPSLLLPYSDPSSVANLTQAGRSWPSRGATGPEERQISFEMSDEGVESVILFAWWQTNDGDIFYERIVQQILISA